jgi:membrane protease YdiL (CAAX protease family)
MVVVLVLGMVLRLRNLRRDLFPPPRQPLIPWDLGEILVAFVLVLLMPAFVFLILKYSGFFQWWYGANPTRENRILSVRCGLWAETLALPFTLLAIVGLLAARGVRPWQFGLTTWRFGPTLAAACLAWWLVTPAVFGVHFVDNMIAVKVLKQPPQEHPLKEIAGAQTTSVEWVLITTVALVRAPVLEELIFRGLLLPWMARRWWSGPLAWGVAIVVAGVLHPGQLPQSLAGVFHSGWAPLYFAVVAGAPLGLAFFRDGRALRGWLAIWGSSLLFAVAHSNVWPSPIPLLFLGASLGYLMLRTRSLVAPVVLHCLFNAVSTWLMLCGLA